MVKVGPEALEAICHHGGYLGTPSALSKTNSNNQGFEKAERFFIIGKATAPENVTTFEIQKICAEKLFMTT